MSTSRRSSGPARGYELISLAEIFYGSDRSRFCPDVEASALYINELYESFHPSEHEHQVTSGQSGLSISLECFTRAAQEMVNRGQWALNDVNPGGVDFLEPITLWPKLVGHYTDANGALPRGADSSSTFVAVPVSTLRQGTEMGWGTAWTPRYCNEFVVQEQNNLPVLQYAHQRSADEEQGAAYDTNAAGTADTGQPETPDTGTRRAGWFEDQAKSDHMQFSPH